jgi:hypothetical protein
MSLSSEESTEFWVVLLSWAANCTAMPANKSIAIKSRDKRI